MSLEFITKNVEAAMLLEEGNVNPHTSELYSDEYKKLLKSRRQLPVANERVQIIHAWENNRVIIIESETGSGKSTQVPGYIFSRTKGKDKCSLAARVATEQDVKPGEHVGYRVRNDRRASNRTKIGYMIEGILLQDLNLPSGARDWSQLRLQNDELIVLVLVFVLANNDQRPQRILPITWNPAVGPGVGLL
ncbi:P-loop containing nucleoside triphosphate hydrolase protein [Apiospora sp. TS-2023a]